jgi:AcrR family transcriptional regulator
MVTARSTATLRRRTGGRSARVVHDVLEAALDEMARVGYAALRFEDVAARAGVSRTTIYRRWPTKADLVRAAALSMVDDEAAAPDTGSLRRDLVDMLSAKVCRWSARDVALMRGVMAESTDPDLVALVRLVRSRHDDRYAAMVERAIMRGELPRGTDPRLVVEPIAAPFHLRLCLLSETSTREEIERVVDVVLAGARTGAAIPSGGDAQREEPGVRVAPTESARAGYRGPALRLDAHRLLADPSRTSVPCSPRRRGPPAPGARR